MADAEDLKSSGDFSSCGFDSHPGHQSFPFVLNQLTRAPVRHANIHHYLNPKRQHTFYTVRSLHIAHE